MIWIILLFLFSCNHNPAIVGDLATIQDDYDGFIVRYIDKKDLPTGENALYQVKGQYNFGGAPFLWVEAKEGVLVDRLMGFFDGQEGVVYVEPNYIRKPFASTATPHLVTDPYWSGFQYARSLCAQEEAYATYGIGEHESFAAVVDSGIDLTHEDLSKYTESGRLLGWSAFNREDKTRLRTTGTTYTKVTTTVPKTINGVESDVLEYVDMHPLIPVLGTAKNWDGNNYPEGHGSHVTGILGAEGNNGKGISGICPANLTMAVYKVLAVNTSSFESMGGASLETYSCLVDLVSRRDNGELKYAGSEVVPEGQLIPINYSLGGRGFSNFEVEMVNYATDNNILLIAASGNDDHMTENYPAALPATMSVGSVDNRAMISQFSSGSERLSVVAPGEDILSLEAGAYDAGGNLGPYVISSGTSMASPYVTGLAAYLLTFRPDLTAAELRTVIEETATDLGAEGHDPWYGHGLVNVKKAVEKVVNGEITSKYIHKSVKVILPSNYKGNFNLIVSSKDGKYLGSSIATLHNNSGEESYIASFPMLPVGEYSVSIANEPDLVIENFEITAADIENSKTNNKEVTL